MHSDKEGTTLIGHNNRPIQNLNNRTIHISYDPEASSAAAAIVTNVILLILSIVYSLCY